MEEEVGVPKKDSGVDFTLVFDTLLLDVEPKGDGEVWRVFVLVVFNGRRGGSIDPVCDGGAIGSQYCVEKGSIDFIFGSV